MPRFDSDPTQVTATQEALPAGDYEFVVTRVAPFVKLNEDQSPKNWGVRYILTVAEGPLAGRTLIQNCYEHSENAKPLNKAFVMACMGYPRGKQHENRFNSDYADKEWYIDTDANEVGDGWQLPIGNRVVGTLGIRLYQGEEQQEIKGWRPLQAA